MPKDIRRFFKIALRRIQLGSLLLSNDQNAVTACVINLVLRSNIVIYAHAWKMNYALASVETTGPNFTKCNKTVWILR